MTQCIHSMRPAGSSLCLLAIAVQVSYHASCCFYLLIVFLFINPLSVSIQCNYEVLNSTTHVLTMKVIVGIQRIVLLRGINIIHLHCFIPYPADLCNTHNDICKQVNYKSNAVKNIQDTRGAQFNRLRRLIDCLLRIDSQSRGERANRLIAQ